MGPFRKWTLPKGRGDSVKEHKIVATQPSLPRTTLDYFIRCCLTPALTFLAINSRASTYKRMFLLLFSMLISLYAQFISVPIYFNIWALVSLRRKRTQFCDAQQTFHFVDKMLLQNPVMFYVVSFFQLWLSKVVPVIQALNWNRKKTLLKGHCWSIMLLTVVFKPWLQTKVGWRTFKIYQCLIGSTPDRLNQNSCQ